jgi:hypothetical protein
MASSYLEKDRLSYRRAVAPAGVGIGYETPSKVKKIDERKLHHATVYRMLTWLAGQVIGFTTGMALIAVQDPESSLHRFAGDVAPHKFRSPERQRVLSQARRLLHLVDHWDRTFPEKFFPRFATRSGFS